MKLCIAITFQQKKLRHAFDFPQNKLDTPIFDTDSFAVHRGEVEGSSTYTGHTKELALVKVTHLPRFGKNREQRQANHLTWQLSVKLHESPCGLQSKNCVMP